MRTRIDSATAVMRKRVAGDIHISMVGSRSSLTRTEVGHACSVKAFYEWRVIRPEARRHSFANFNIRWPWPAKLYLGNDMAARHTNYHTGMTSQGFRLLSRNSFGNCRRRSLPAGECAGHSVRTIALTKTATFDFRLPLNWPAVHKRPPRDGFCYPSTALGPDHRHAEVIPLRTHTQGSHPRHDTKYCWRKCTKFCKYVERKA